MPRGPRADARLEASVANDGSTRTSGHAGPSYGSQNRFRGHIPKGRRLQKLWEHPWQNWGLLIHAGILTVLVRTGLSVGSLRQATQGLRRTARWLPQWAASTPTYRRRAVWAARIAGQQLLPEGPCLTQALVLQYLLLRRGDDAAQLHIGVAKREDEQFLAHAWVERKGDVLIGGAASPRKYERFDNLSTKIEARDAADPSPDRD